MAQSSGKPVSNEQVSNEQVSNEQVSNEQVSGETLSYEAARDELLDVVRQLEAGGVPLEQSLVLWERGEQLAVLCQGWLDGAKERLAARRPEAASVPAVATPDDGGSR
jgi:exodeoxyribonuclease VII small subunit